jgi:RTX calcium-binding nonapeptide repeat (4 copies)
VAVLVVHGPEAAEVAEPGQTTFPVPSAIRWSLYRRREPAPTASSPSRTPPPTFCRGRPGTLVARPGSGPLAGTGQAEAIVGGRGADVIDGRGGDDLICGRGGDDRLFGQASRDRLAGGWGKDRLAGGRGNYRLWGGSGTTASAGGRAATASRAAPGTTGSWPPTGGATWWTRPRPRQRQSRSLRPAQALRAGGAGRGPRSAPLARGFTFDGRGGSLDRGRPVRRSPPA